MKRNANKDLSLPQAPVGASRWLARQHSTLCDVDGRRTGPPLRVWMVTFVLLIFPLLTFAQNTATVSSINVTGNKRTKEKVITRQLTFTLDDEIDLDQLDEIIEKNENNVYNTGLFNVVKLTGKIDGDQIAFTIDVKERWYIWPIPYVDLEERTFNEWWEDKDLDRLVYGLGVEWQNFTGWNDRLLLYGQNGYSRRISVQLRRPFIFGGPNTDALFTYRHVSNKEIGYATEDGILQLARLQDHRIRNSHTGSVMFTRRLSPRKQLQFSASYQYFRLHDSIQYFNPLYLTNGNRVEQYPILGFAFVNDQRDLFSFPLKGHKLSFSIRKQGLFGWGTSDFAKFSASWSHHIPIGKRLNFAYGNQTFMLLGKQVPYYDKYFVGFGSFLRGYEYFVIDGSFVNLTKFEWKFAIIPRKIIHVPWIPFKKFQDFPLGVYISLYSDNGYVSDGTFNNLDRTLKNQHLFGYGVGLNVITIYDSLIRLEYSRNHLGFGGIFISGLVSIQ